MPVRIYIVGRVAIEHGGKAVEQEEFPGRQGVIAFARLAFDRHVAVGRGELAEAIWSGEPPRAWDAALSAIASKLRSLLARAGLGKDALASALGCYQLNLPVDAWVDAEAAFDSLHEAEGCLRAGRRREAWSAAQAAYHICRRPFLAGEEGAWVAAAREQVATTFVRACECLADVYIWNREPAVAVDVARQAIATQPFRETGYQLLMRAHAAAGNKAEALRAYEDCRKRISDELGVAPSPETQAVYRELLRSR
ncbi:MAG TPA: bacterial transcriptional activator domain-containing protein [Usitatibacter sp.]|nr:bacterial transcriptional activator domain-containing protein [Usitatibacter sp.]